MSHFLRKKVDKGFSSRNWIQFWVFYQDLLTKILIIISHLLIVLLSQINLGVTITTHVNAFLSFGNWRDRERKRAYFRNGWGFFCKISSWHVQKSILDAYLCVCLLKYCLNQGGNLGFAFFSIFLAGNLYGFQCKSVFSNKLLL